MNDKKIAMLDDQSPINKELKYAFLTFNKMTKEQKKAVVNKKEGGYEKWENGLKRIGTIGIFEKNTSEEKISKITKCDTHTKIGVIEKEERPKNGFVLSEKTDLENTEAFKK